MNQLPTAPAAPPLQQPPPLHLYDAAIAFNLIRDQWRKHVRITLYSLAGLVNSVPRAIELMRQDIETEADEITGRQS